MQARIPTSAITHITQRSLPELEELHALLGQHGVGVWQVQSGVPMGNMVEDRQSLLGPSRLAELLPRLAALRKTGRRPRLVAADNIG